MKDDRNLRGVKHLLTVQLSLCLLISAGVLFAFGKHDAMSALLGGLVAFLPLVLFAKKMFQYQGARAARLIVKNFYLGEFLKIVTSILLFTLVFFLYEVTPLAFFLTYIAVVMAHWFAPLIIDNKQNRPESD